MILKNVKVFTEEKKFVEGMISMKNGVFDRIATKKEEINEMLQSIADQTGEEILDGGDCYAIPGLIDLHFHGCMGVDFCDGTKEALDKIAQYEASVGVTAIAPATMTLPVEELERILAVAADYQREATKGADLIGINMEGPFISEKKKGAQNDKYIIGCNEEICGRFLKASNGLVKFVGIAPEQNPQFAEFIEQMKKEVNISLAHTNTDYKTAVEAFCAGANHVVHLYNAMPPFNHRDPGVVGAAFDCKDVMSEIICDGIHIHPAMVRATFQMMGDRMILISDSMRATGMPDGQYTLGGLDVIVKGKRATLVSDGALAGSVTNLMDCVRTAVQMMEIPLENAVTCATMNPAKSLGVYDQYGSIAVGKKANVVLLDSNLDLQAVIKDGIRLS